MGENKKSNDIKQLDILEIIKEVKNSNFTEFKIKAKGIEIEMKAEKAEKAEASEVDTPIHSPQIAYKTQELVEDDTESLINRVKRQDESLLEELDYDPDLKCDLMENNVIEMGVNGEYKYVEERDYAEEA